MQISVLKWKETVLKEIKQFCEKYYSLILFWKVPVNFKTSIVCHSLLYWPKILTWGCCLKALQKRTCEYENYIGFSSINEVSFPFLRRLTPARVNYNIYINLCQELLLCFDVTQNTEKCNCWWSQSCTMKGIAQFVSNIYFFMLISFNFFMY